jgi:hypothetical protein
MKYIRSQRLDFLIRKNEIDYEVLIYEYLDLSFEHSSYSLPNSNPNSYSNAPFDNEETDELCNICMINAPAYVSNPCCSFKSCDDCASRWDSVSSGKCPHCKKQRKGNQTKEKQKKKNHATIVSTVSFASIPGYASLDKYFAKQKDKSVLDLLYGKTQEETIDFLQSNKKYLINGETGLVYNLRTGRWVLRDGKVGKSIMTETN